MKNWSWLCFIAVFLVHSSAHAAEAARVNGVIITDDQVNAHYSEMANQSSEPLTRKAVLDDLIKREVAVQEARRLKLDRDPAVLDRLNSVLYFSLLDKKLGAEFDKVTITDAEAKAWYEKNPEVRTSQIYIALPPASKPEDEKKAAERLNLALRDIKSGKISFGEVAQQISEDSSAALGGDMDYRSKDQLDPGYYRVAVKLGKPGETSNVMRLSTGLAIIRLTGKRTWIEVDRSKVKRIMMEEKRQIVIDRYLNDLRQKAAISVK